MATPKPMTIVLPNDLVRETKRAASAESTTPAKLVEAALRQYLTSRRWQRLRRWGAETAKRLGIKTEADLVRFIRRRPVRARMKPR